jgi:hypothetical protein
MLAIAPILTLSMLLGTDWSPNILAAAETTSSPSMIASFIGKLGQRFGDRRVTLRKVGR